MLSLMLIALIAETDGKQFLKVQKHDAQNVSGTKLAPWSSFGELLENAEQSDVAPSVTVPTRRLVPPFPRAPLKSLGLGLSYPSHQQEVDASNTVFFDKNAAPTRIDAPITFREHLDFEAEVSILMHRQEKNLFGYLLHNDLTDRGIQVETNDPDDPGPGFSLSKSFPGANAHGYLMAVGTGDIWKQLQVELFVNGKKVQTVNPEENVLTPEEMHRHVFFASDLAQGKDWVILGTGTPAGTIFRAPTFSEKIGLLIRAGFNMKRAGQLWLKKFHFLKAGDRLEFRSASLGNAMAEVVTHGSTLRQSDK